MMRLPSGLRLLCTEVAALCRFLWRTPRAEKQLVFYAEHGDYYPYFEGLLEQLTRSHSQPLAYITSDHGDPILESPGPLVRPFYLRRLLPFFMAYVNCKVFVMTLTDLNRFHLKRSVHPVHYVYVFHSLVSTHMIYRHGSFDHYDSILCCGPHHVAETRRHEELTGLQPKTLVEAGYYRLERIYLAKRRHDEERPHTTAKRTILVAPSWGADNVLESCGERLTEILLNAGYDVIVRPHPETVKRSPSLVSLFASKFGHRPGFTLETSVATDDSMLQADVLISDYSGISLEYAFGTDRPVLFLDVPAKVNNDRYRELGLEPLELSLRTEIGVVVSPQELDTIPQVISDLIRSEPFYRERIRVLRGQYSYNFGHSSEIGARHIADLVAADSHPDSPNVS
jgi:YidC/Oxa1 family membrane protein insertase